MFDFTDAWLAQRKEAATTFGKVTVNGETFPRMSGDFAKKIINYWYNETDRALGNQLLSLVDPALSVPGAAWYNSIPLTLWEAYAATSIRDNPIYHQWLSTVYNYQNAITPGILPFAKTAGASLLNNSFTKALWGSTQDLAISTNAVVSLLSSNIFASPWKSTPSTDTLPTKTYTPNYNTSKASQTSIVPDLDFTKPSNEGTNFTAIIFLLFVTIGGYIYFSRRQK